MVSRERETRKIRQQMLVASIDRSNLFASDYAAADISRRRT
jgi:hypothetical protein